MRIDKENDIIYFDNDEEFYDFCVETYSINRRVRDHRVRKAGWDFSDWYQSNVNEDTKIVILDSNSTICVVVAWLLAVLVSPEKSMLTVSIRLILRIRSC